MKMVTSIHTESSGTMRQLWLPVLLVMLPVLLDLALAAPGYRYFSPPFAGEQEIALPDTEDWLAPEMFSDRLADFLVRSSHTIGTVYGPPSLGSDTYGKRSVLGVSFPNY
ncbi:hypothetical protein CRUP_033007 [Coryphaenoides rupestris]|nr:hypothetical protein CRUP_033007 [Coryphaenoides rupestris]